MSRACRYVHTIRTPSIVAGGIRSANPDHLKVTNVDFILRSLARAHMRSAFYFGTSEWLCVLLTSSPGRLLRKSALGGEITDDEYLGAAMRLTAELSRYAITQVNDR